MIVVLCLIRISGDIELNPGPKPCNHVKCLVTLRRWCGHRFKSKGGCPSHKHATIKPSNENKRLDIHSKRQLESKEEVVHRREVSTC